MTDSEVDEIDRRIAAIRNEGRSLTHDMDRVITDLRLARFALDEIGWRGEGEARVCVKCGTGHPKHTRVCSVGEGLGFDE